MVTVEDHIVEGGFERVPGTAAGLGRSTAAWSFWETIAFKSRDAELSEAGIDVLAIAAVVRRAVHAKPEPVKQTDDLVLADGHARRSD